MAQSPTFMDELPAAAARRVRSLGWVSAYAPKDPLVHQGSAVDDVIVIESGLVRCGSSASSAAPRSCW